MINFMILFNNSNWQCSFYCLKQGKIDCCLRGIKHLDCSTMSYDHHRHFSETLQRLGSDHQIMMQLCFRLCFDIHLYYLFYFSYIIYGCLQMHFSSRLHFLFFHCFHVQTLNYIVTSFIIFSLTYNAY
jgi:hypothetical protein